MTESWSAPGSPSRKDVINTFRKCWMTSTDDNNLTLHGFRRFKTTHLLNLRFLEDEIAEMDHTIYQAGLSLGQSPSSLGLNHVKKDANAPSIDDAITREFVLKLRDLLGQYGLWQEMRLIMDSSDGALAAFNKIMPMETCSLLDDEKQSSLQEDLSLYEVYKTRLVRVDLETRSRTDPFQRWLHRYLRAFRYWRLSNKSQNNKAEDLGSFTGGRRRWSYQNTILIAEIIGRVTIAVLTTVFLVTPLVILSQESSKDVQLYTQLQLSLYND
ncbi:MAG: hypothetical protein M1816_003918 [Peltula sp. TS41687]|nr:MAG: hypothetical protein M1816_003918 [Peltula sp. TS41687]